MKRIFLVFTALLILFTVSCGSDKNAPLPDDVIRFNENIWPENEFTAGIPVPPGTVADGWVAPENELCNIQVNGIEESDFEEYITALNNDGFTEIRSVSEEIDGEGYTSTGMLLSNGEKSLSIAYIPGLMNMMISLEGLPVIVK